MQCVAGQLLVGCDDLRILDVELAPLLLLAEHLQPVAAQLLGQVSTLVAGNELPRSSRFKLIRQATDEQPVVDIILEIVAAQLTGKPFELDAITDPVGVARSEEAFVLACRRRGDRQ